jgi:hypothetical protein
MGEWFSNSRLKYLRTPIPQHAVFACAEQTQHLDNFQPCLVLNNWPTLHWTVDFHPRTGVCSVCCSLCSTVYEYQDRCETSKQQDKPGYALNPEAHRFAYVKKGGASPAGAIGGVMQRRRSAFRTGTLVAVGETIPCGSCVAQPMFKAAHIIGEIHAALAYRMTGRKIYYRGLGPWRYAFGTCAEH